jgi:hypothetical protein
VFTFEIMDRYVKINGVIWHLIINAMPLLMTNLGIFFQKSNEKYESLSKNIIRSLFEKFNEKYEFHNKG